MKILKNKCYSNIHGTNLYTVQVLGFSTTIAHWKDGKKYQLTKSTTPKFYGMDTVKDFNSVEEATKYYLETTKIYLEDALECLKDIDYKNKETEKCNSTFSDTKDEN